MTTRSTWAALVVAVRFGAALEPVEGGPFSTHTYYRTHNRTREALNHTRFSWFEAQTAFQRCYGGEPPAEDRFVYFTSTSALGNSLNIWVHAFLYALYAGRQLVVGRGLVPDLLCGPAGAFVCGVPYRGEAWLNARPHRNIDYEWTRGRSAPGDAHVAPVTWYSYKHMDGATMRGAKSVDGKPPPKRKAIVDCFPEALRCHRGRNPRNGIDTEACVMLRAMQLLLPGSRLRPEFAAQAVKTAERQWLGDVDEFRTVVRDAARGDDDDAAGAPEPSDWRRPVFFDPPAPSDDAATRWEGALHVRAMPPTLERVPSRPGSKQAEDFGRYVASLANGTSRRLWGCATGSARAEDKILAENGASAAWPKSFFIATDVAGLCAVAHDAVAREHGEENAPRVACMNADPVHLVKPAVTRLPRVIFRHRAQMLPRRP